MTHTPGYTTPPFIIACPDSRIGPILGILPSWNILFPLVVLVSAVQPIHPYYTTHLPISHIPSVPHHRPSTYGRLIFASTSPSSYTLSPPIFNLVALIILPFFSLAHLISFSPLVDLDIVLILPCLIACPTIHELPTLLSNHHPSPRFLIPTADLKRFFCKNETNPRAVAGAHQKEKKRRRLQSTNTLLYVVLGRVDARVSSSSSNNCFPTAGRVLEPSDLSFA